MIIIIIIIIIIIVCQIFYLHTYIDINALA